MWRRRRAHSVRGPEREVDMTVISRLVQIAAIVAMVALGGRSALGEADFAWRQVIIEQVAALRAGDAAAAFALAGAGFHESYTDPARFVADIRQAGYGPLLDSHGLKFGKFERVDDVVAQAISFIAPDQQIYEGLYTLKMEAEGWRVQGVTIRAQNALGV
jgi:Domain of unknown function (DUF4864)